MSEDIQTIISDSERAERKVAAKAIHSKVLNDFSYSNMIMREAAKMLEKQRKEQAPLLEKWRLRQQNQNVR